ncbi:MAG: PilZ domain-containing protein [Desulfuromonadales bacterium]|nr:PilZ domain-containing protein [Desulfuromonadales bacterium]MBN2792722.1 PilZ domain-containing protein [Desulfuromonadales bacterium]
MNYQRYFKPEQQLLLQVENDLSQNARTELMTINVVSCEEDRLVVSLPYDADAVDQYPFREEMPFEITTETMGMGVRTKGRFERKINSSQFAITLHSELQMFQRRISQRFDCMLGIRFSRAAKTLQTMRHIWERNLDVLYSPEAPLIFEGFKSTRVNISSGGIRLSIKPPVNQGELCLTLINLEDGKPPICAIAEVVWMCVKDEDAVTAGMRFINILGDDQKRIDTFIDRNKSNK